MRKVDVWTARYNLAVVDWPDAPFDPFFNANRPEDLAEAEAIIADGLVDGCAPAAPPGQSEPERP